MPNPMILFKCFRSNEAKPHYTMCMNSNNEVAMEGIGKLLYYQLSKGDRITVELAIPKNGEWYYEWDENTQLYCVFHTESSKAYATYSSEKDADVDAKQRNISKVFPA